MSPTGPPAERERQKICSGDLFRRRDPGRIDEIRRHETEIIVREHATRQRPQEHRLLPWSVVSRPLEGEAPTIDVAVGYSNKRNGKKETS
jgi:hypothetical protein